MVVKIYKAAPSCSSAVTYNEQKVAEGHASVIFSSGIEDPSKAMETFSIYERGSLRCQNLSFHASVNPGKDDKMSDEKVREMIKDYMEKMGYGKQPYIIYKHTDLERIHYHIVSVRVDKNGRKIPDSYERKRSQEVLKELSKEYGFAVGKKKEMEEVLEQDVKEEKKEQKRDFNPYNGFDPAKGDVRKQIEAITDLALKYYFKEPQQFDMIMEDLGVKVSRGSTGGREWILLQGLEQKTKGPCTPLIDLSEKYGDLHDTVAQHAEQCKGQRKTKEKEKVANIAKTALTKVKSEKHFKNYLKKFGITVVLNRNVNNQIFGATFIDHKNKCVFKASDLPKFSVKMIEEARQEKWYGEERKNSEHTKHFQHSQQSEHTSKSTAEEATDLLLTALGSESSRRHEDEKIMRRGRKGPN